MRQAWTTVEAHEPAILEAADRLLRDIRAELGPGRVWTWPQRAIVHLVYDHDVLVRLGDDDRPSVMICAAYRHEGYSFSMGIPGSDGSASPR
jgi:hypothetical protein